MLLKVVLLSLENNIMILYLLISVIIDFLTIVFNGVGTIIGSIFGVGAGVLTHLPFGADVLFVQGFSMVHLLSVWIPPLGIMLGGFIAIIVFRFVMLILHLTRIIR